MHISKQYAGYYNRLKREQFYYYYSVLYKYVNRLQAGEQVSAQMKLIQAHFVCLHRKRDLGVVIHSRFKTFNQHEIPNIYLIKKMRGKQALINSYLHSDGKIYEGKNVLCHHPLKFRLILKLIYG